MTTEFEKLCAAWVENRHRGQDWSLAIYRVARTMVSVFNEELGFPATYQDSCGNTLPYVYLAKLDENGTAVPVNGMSDWFHFDEDEQKNKFTIAFMLEGGSGVSRKGRMLLEYSFVAFSDHIDISILEHTQSISFKGDEKQISDLVRHSSQLVLKFLQSPYGARSAPGVGFGR